MKYIGIYIYIYIYIYILYHIYQYKYLYLRGKEILPSDQSRMIEQAKFTYSPLEKAFYKINKQKEILKKIRLKLCNLSMKDYHPIKDFISNKRLNTEFMNQNKRTEEEDKKSDRNIML